MNARMLRILGIAVVVLVAVLFIVELDRDESTDPRALFPDLRASVESIDDITVSRQDQDDVEIEKSAGEWVVAGRDNYPADMAKVRALLLALTDAVIVETKTANPERYSRLGLDDPETPDSEGVRIVARGGDAVFGVILGTNAQGGRYARRQGEDQAWLIDQDTDVPATAGDWLAPDVLDIEASRIRALTITHPDEQIIRIRKESDEDIDFDVADVPDGRELTYSTVANGIAGALKDLELDDVRRGDGLPDAMLTEFETFDGLTILVRTSRDDDASWISVNATGDDAVADEAAAINERVSGWQYRIADYKADLLTRTWDDILKPVE